MVEAPQFSGGNASGPNRNLRAVSKDKHTSFDPIRTAQSPCSHSIQRSPGRRNATSRAGGCACCGCSSDRGAPTVAGKSGQGKRRSERSEPPRRLSMALGPLLFQRSIVQSARKDRLRSSTSSSRQDHSSRRPPVKHRNTTLCSPAT